MKHGLPKIFLCTLLLVLINLIQGCGINTDLDEPTSIAPEEEGILANHPTPKRQTAIPNAQEKNKHTAIKRTLLSTNSQENDACSITSSITSATCSPQESNQSTDLPKEETAQSTASSVLAIPKVLYNLANHPTPKGQTAIPNAQERNKHTAIKRTLLSTNSQEDDACSITSSITSATCSLQESYQSTDLPKEETAQSTASSVLAIPKVLHNLANHPTRGIGKTTVPLNPQETEKLHHNIKQQAPKISSDPSTAPASNSTQNGGPNSMASQGEQKETNDSPESEEYYNDTTKNSASNDGQKNNGRVKPLNKAQQQELKSLVNKLDLAIKSSIDDHLKEKRAEEVSIHSLDSLDDTMDLLEEGKRTIGLLSLFERAIETAEQNPEHLKEKIAEKVIIRSLDSLEDAMYLLEKGKMTVGLLSLFERAIEKTADQKPEIYHSSGDGNDKFTGNFFARKDKITQQLADIKKLLAQSPE